MKKEGEVLPEYNGSPLETEEKLLFGWQAPGRLFKTRGKEFYSTILVLAVLLSVIMFLIEGIMPVFLIWSIVFLVWVLSKTKPAEVEYKITSWGLRSDGQLYQWEEMNVFWIEEKNKELVLRILLTRKFPGQLVAILNQGDENKVAELMKRRVRLEKPAATMTDKVARWLSEKVPLTEG